MNKLGEGIRDKINSQFLLRLKSPVCPKLYWRFFRQLYLRLYLQLESRLCLALFIPTQEEIEDTIIKSLKSNESIGRKYSR